MATKKVRAADLRGPVDEGESTRKGSRVLMDGRSYRVVNKRVNARNTIVDLDFVQIIANPNEQTSATRHVECAPGDKFEEIVEG